MVADFGVEFENTEFFSPGDETPGFEGGVDDGLGWLTVF
jgi:hypothetical protein